MNNKEKNILIAILILCCLGFLIFIMLHKAEDVNYDGVVDTSDLLQVQKCILDKNYCK